MYFNISYVCMDAAAVLVLVILFLKGLCSNGTINIIVSKDGSGNYTSVSEAIRNAPDWSHQPYIVHVLAGIYEEYIFIPPSKINIKLLGHGSNHTILVAHQNGSTIGTLSSLIYLFYPHLISLRYFYIYSSCCL